MQKPHEQADAIYDENGDAEVHAATRAQDLVWLKEVLTEDVGAVSHKTLRGESSALHIAIELGWTEGVLLLLENNASPTTVDKRGRSAADYAVRHARHGALTLFLRHGLDPNTKSRSLESGGATVTTACARLLVSTHPSNPVYAEYLRLTQLLVREGGDINAPDLHGKTPMYYAVMGKAEKACNDLLKLGALEVASLEAVSPLVVSDNTQWASGEQHIRMRAGTFHNQLIHQASEAALSDTLTTQHSPTLEETEDEASRAARANVQKNRVMRL